MILTFEQFIHVQFYFDSRIEDETKEKNTTYILCTDSYTQYGMKKQNIQVEPRYTHVQKVPELSLFGKDERNYAREFMFSFSKRLSSSTVAAHFSQQFSSF